MRKQEGQRAAHHHSLRVRHGQPYRCRRTQRHANQADAGGNALSRQGVRLRALTLLDGLALGVRPQDGLGDGISLRRGHLRVHVGEPVADLRLSHALGKVRRSFQTGSNSDIVSRRITCVVPACWKQNTRRF